MREARSVTVTAWINDRHNTDDAPVHEAFVSLLRALEAAVERWHRDHEDVVDGVPVVRLR